MCEKLKAAGIAPIALGSKNRWPAQFWFDYLVLRTAGPDYRADLMSGTASYTDPEVEAAMGMWKELVDAGYFAANANADDWTDAADKVARGEAAMTLMGTWITGYWNSNKLVPGTDYDFFEFPTVIDGVAQGRGGTGRWPGHLVRCQERCRGRKAAVLPRLRSGRAGQVGRHPGRAVGQRQGRSGQLHVGDAARARRRSTTPSAFAFNYDLATPPPVAEVGLSMFAQFMDNPADYKAMLEADPDRRRRRLQAVSRHEPPKRGPRGDSRRSPLWPSHRAEGEAAWNRQHTILADRPCWRCRWLVFGVLVVWPLFSSFYYSFTNWNGFDPDYDFVGLRQFRPHLHRPAVLQAIVNTAIWMVAAILLPTGLGLGLALLIDSRVPGGAIFKSIFYLPICLSAVVVGQIWIWIYQPDWGLLNTLIGAVTGQDAATSPGWPSPARRSTPSSSPGRGSRRASPW